MTVENRGDLLTDLTSTTPLLPASAHTTISVVQFGSTPAPPPQTSSANPLPPGSPLHDDSFKQSLPEGSVNIVLPDPRSSKPSPLHHKLFGVIHGILPFSRAHNTFFAHKGSHLEQNENSPKVSPVGTGNGRVIDQVRYPSTCQANRKSCCSSCCTKQSRSSLSTPKKKARKCSFSRRRSRPKDQPAETEDERDNFGPSEPAKAAPLDGGVELVEKPSGRIVRKLFCVNAETGASILDTWLWKYIMGDAPGFSAFTTRQKGRLWWYPLVFLDYCRGAGRMVRVNNPWSGVIFIVAMGLQDVYQLIFAALGAASASATAWCLNTPTVRYKNGAIYFNGFLLGLFIWNNGNYNPQDATAWWCVVPVLFFGVMSAFVKNALDGVCNMYRVPVSSFPYGLLVLCYLGSQLSTPHPAFPGNGVPIPTGLDVPLGYRPETIIHGIFFSISQVFYCGNLRSVILCWCAVLLNSPLHCCMLMSGAAIGTYIATLLGVLPLQLYTGMWSFNSMLVMSYLGGHFWVLNGWAFPFSCVAAAFATILCGLLYHVLGSVKLPFCGIPFFLSLSTFLLVASGTDMSFFIHRVRSPTYHERHLVDYLRHKSSNPAPSLYRDKKKFRLPVLSLIFEGQTTLDSVREEIRPMMKKEIETEMQENAMKKAADTGQSRR